MVTKFASTVSFIPKASGNHYQNWYNTDNLKKSSAKATCGISGSVATVIGGKNGSWPIPSPLTLTDFNFALPNGTKVEKVIVHYAQQKHTMSSATAYPSFTGAKFTLLGTGKSLTGAGVPTSYTHGTLEFEGITLEQINSPNFGLTIEYPKNGNTNTGLISLGDVSIEVITSVPRLTVNATTPSTKIIKGSVFEVEFDVTRLENIAVNPICEISYDAGVTYQAKVSGVGTLTTTSDNNTFLWNSNYTTGNSNKVKLRFKADTEGIKKFTILDTITNKQYVLTVTVVNYTTTVSTTLNTNTVPFKINEEVTYQINVKTTNPDLESQPLMVELPLGTTITNLSSLRTTNSAAVTTTSTNVKLAVTAKIINGQSSITIKATFAQSGYLTQNILINNVSANQVSFIVQSTNYGKLGFTRVRIPEEVTENMGNNIEYVLCTLARFVQKGSDTVTDYVNNLRVGVFNDEETHVNNEDNFVKMVEWCNNISTKNFVLYTNRFIYDEDCPLFFVYSHDYTGDPVRDNLSFDFTEAILIEYDEYQNLIDYKDFPKPIKALLANGDYASCTVQPQDTTSPVLLYSFDSGGLFDLPEFICQGITITGNYTASHDVEIAFNVSVDQKKGYRNKTLKQGSGEFQVGNKYDLFGLKPHDLRETLSDIVLHMVLNNQYDEEVHLELNNITLTVTYFLMDDQQGFGFEVDGERSEEYGIYFNEFDYNVGTKNDLSMYQIPGTDETIPYRMNITDKEISLEISIDDCDIEESALLVDKLVKLFTNDRHTLTNKPIPKSIIFDVLDDRRFWWIRKDEIDSTWDYGGFEGKIKLVIPSGTAELIEPTITGSSGSNPGVAAALPKITVLAKSEGEIHITERYRDQKVIIENDNIEIGDTIIIDNKNRHATLQKQNTTESTDITASINYDTTWFSLINEYLLESDDAIILSVEYHEER